VFRAERERRIPVIGAVLCYLGLSLAESAGRWRRCHTVARNASGRLGEAVESAWIAPAASKSAP
jgi:hypothetical protein